MTKKVLIADDEPNQLELLAFNLMKAGFDVYRASHGKQALAMVESISPDIVILDWMMPEMSGIDVCKAMRASATMASIPVIMLSARGEEGDKTFGLDTGADDYVTKPFSPRELISRIRAVLRRAVTDNSPVQEQAEQQAASTPSGDIREFQGLRIDYQEMRVSRDGVTIKLGPKEFKILALLMTYPGRVYSRSQLLDHVWGEDIYVEDRTVDVHLSRLRKALRGNDAEKSDLLRTVRGAGYALKAAEDL